MLLFALSQVAGGGYSGQAQAVRHGIARAIVVAAPSTSLQLAKLVVWDGRKSERKKPGQKGARKGFT